MKTTIEFLQDETKAALHLMETWKEEAKSNRELAEGAANEKYEPWIALSWLMEAEVLERGAEQLRRDIENQNFNF